jgi:hypothetical protein
MPLGRPSSRKEYASSTINRLTPEEAKKLLTEEVRGEDREGVDLLELLHRERRVRIRFLAECVANTTAKELTEHQRPLEAETRRQKAGYRGGGDKFGLPTE